MKKPAINPKTSKQYKRSNTSKQASFKEENLNTNGESKNLLLKIRESQLQKLHALYDSCKRWR